MKIALYIEDGRDQIVLTPQSDTEKAILAKLHSGSIAMTIKKGSFYACQGGYTRQQAGVEDSTFIVMDKEEGR